MLMQIFIPDESFSAIFSSPASIRKVIVYRRCGGHNADYFA
jgi:hypothetical protein